MTDNTMAPGGIAVIGLACRMPGANDANEFWCNIAGKKESIRHFQRDELIRRGVEEERIAVPGFVPAQSALENIDLFDAAFFNISPAEAEIMDPQQRIFLESCYQALEDAGYASEKLQQRCGVFAGSGISTYLLRNLVIDRELVRRRGEGPILWANDKDYLATMVAYRLNLTGASLNINTACSTSLVTVSMAFDSLLNFDVDLALAGGVRIEVADAPGYDAMPGGIFSPDGHCRVFDASAQGTVFGDGCGVVVLKRLEEAIADGDNIYAVIAGHAVNNDGAEKAGFGAPSQDGQTRVIKEAWQFAGIHPRDIACIEAHGTGTAVGDPIEVAALQDAFGCATDATGFCAIGSVKSNIGHCGAAAGVASLIKIIKALQHRQLPPTINFTTANPVIDFSSTALYVNTDLKAWPARNAARIAGVSSFGIGGTNCHLVVREKPPLTARESVGPHSSFPLLLSARHPDVLQTQKRDLIEHLRQHKDLSLADVAYTLAVGRNEYGYRYACTCRDRDSAIAALQAGVELIQPHKSRPVAFLFPGQGELYPGMGRELYRQEPVFQRAYDACADTLRKILGWDLRDYIDPTAATEVERARELRQPPYAQPALFAFEYSLAQLWMSWGVEPDALIGYSLGEYVAACVAGVWSLEDALKLVVERGSTLEPVAETFELILRTVASHPPQRAMFSTVTGGWLSEGQRPQVEQWARYRRETVDFTGGLAQILLRYPEAALLEVGPQSMQNQLSREHPVPVQRVINSMDHLPEPGGAQQFRLPDAATRLWQLGVALDWQAYYRYHPGNRVPLPTYPFLRTRYWIAADNKRLPDSDREHSSAICKLYIPSWRLSQRASGRGPSAAGMSKVNYLVFSNRDCSGDYLIDVLERQGHSVISVVKAERFEIGEREYSINPQYFSDYYALFNHLQSMAWSANRIISCWNLNPAAASDTLAAEQSPAESLIGLMNIARAAIQIPYHKVSELRVLTSGVVDFGNGADISPLSCALASACSVLDDEFDLLNCQCIDIFSRENQASDSDFSGALEDELATPVRDRVVVLRKGRRWLATLEPFEAEAPEPALNPIKHNGHYVVAGALGGIGRALCQWLAQQAPVNLTLVVRSGLPPQSDWSALLARGDGDSEIRQQLQHLVDLRSKCLALDLIEADIADADALEQAWQGRSLQKSADGVFHLAGVASRNLIQEKTGHSITSGVQAKVQGTLNLYRLFARQQPDFIVLFSSLSAQLGGVGQYEYSAANAFMDAFAQRMASRATCRILSINWDRWQEAGISASGGEPALVRKLKAASLAETLGSKEALDALRHILVHGDSGNPQFIVTRRALDGVSLSRRREKPDAPAHRDIRLYDRPQLAADYIELETETERRLGAIWQELMRIDRVGREDDFLELGGDSLLSIQMISKVNEEFDIALNAVSLFEATVLRQLAQLIDSLMAGPGQPEVELEEFEL